MSTIQISKAQTLPVGANITLKTSRRRNRKKQNATVVLQQPLTQNRSRGRTLRNRRRRLRKRLLGGGAIAPAVTPANYFSRYFTHNDPTMELSVHQNLQTLFYPQKGIHRGIANGLEPTAIAYYQGSAGFATTATNNVITFLAIPALVAKTQVVDEGAFFSSLAATGTNTPYGAGSSRFSGPFAVTNPMSTGRVVSFSLTLIPSSAVLNRGGAGKIGYIPEYLNADWTTQSMDNYSISRAWDGTESMCMHWVPGVNEYDFGSGTSTTAAYSGLYGYMVLPLGTIASWRVEWQIGIEYNPTAAYKPLVDRKPPAIRPDARYFVNQVVTKHWIPLMISSWENYETRLGMAESLGGLSDFVYVDHAGAAGVGFMNPGEADEDFEVMERAGGTPNFSGFSGVVNSIKNVACDVGEALTGERICENPFQSAVNIGMNMVGNNSYRPNARSFRSLRN